MAAPRREGTNEVWTLPPSPVNVSNPRTPLMHRLILHPADPMYAPRDPDAVVAGLQRLGFAGAEVGGRAWRVGPRFMEWVSFLGCSPHLRLEPTAPGEAYTHLEIPLPRPAPVLLAGLNVKPPRCPRCGRAFAERAVLRVLPVDPAARRECMQCGHRAAWLELDWRRSACAARWWIGITGIHESEAVPNPALLDRLGRLGGDRWNYCYVRDG
jgi:hypothetical protein